MDPALLFTWITTQIDNAMQGGVTQNYVALIAALRPVVTAGLVLWLAISSVSRLAGWNVQPVAHLFRDMAIGAGVLAYCFVEANYGAWARDVIQNGLAQPAMAVMANGAGGAQISGNAFDSLVAKSVATGVSLFKTVGMSPTTWVMLVFVPIYFGISLLAIVAAFLAWILPHVILGLLVAIGPIACATLPFSVTRSVFHSWARTCLSMVVLQLLIVGLLTIVLAADRTVMQQVMTMADAGISADSSQMGQLIGVAFGAAAVNLLLGISAIVVPAIASAMTGGAYTSVTTVTTAAGSAVSGAASRAAAAGAASSSAGASAAAGGSVARSSAPIGLPPGPAIWSSKP